MNVEPAAITDPRAAVCVFYDGACPLCRREIGWYMHKRGADALGWLDVSAATDASLPAGLTRQDLLLRFTVERADGATARGAAGFVALWRALPGTARIGRVLDNPVTVGIGELAYRGFLRLRRLWRRAR